MQYILAVCTKQNYITVPVRGPGMQNKHNNESLKKTSNTRKRGSGEKSIVKMMSLIGHPDAKYTEPLPYNRVRGLYSTIQATALSKYLP
jgi:hypothetical protein